MQRYHFGSFLPNFCSFLPNFSSFLPDFCSFFPNFCSFLTHFVLFGLCFASFIYSIKCCFFPLVPVHPWVVPFSGWFFSLPKAHSAPPSPLPSSSVQRPVVLRMAGPPPPAGGDLSLAQLQSRLYALLHADQASFFARRPPLRSGGKAVGGSGPDAWVWVLDRSAAYLLGNAPRRPTFCPSLVGSRAVLGGWGTPPRTLKSPAAPITPLPPT